MNLPALFGTTPLAIYHLKVVGGTSLLSGIGNMIGISLSALIIILINNALVLARIPYE